MPVQGQNFNLNYPHIEPNNNLIAQEQEQEQNI